MSDFDGRKSDGCDSQPPSGSQIPRASVEPPIHVLVAEDDDACAYSLERNLLRAGFRVTTVGSSMEAIQLLRHGDVDVLLSDQQMPLVTGSQLCLLLRNDPRYRNLPVIMMTGKGNEFDARQLANECGLAAIFLKPFDTRELIQTIRQVARRHTDTAIERCDR